MEINESNQYPSEEFCNAKRNDFIYWIGKGGQGANPCANYPELQNDFTFIPKVEEVKPEPTQEELDAQRVAEIKGELVAIDQKSIRPMREGDTARLEEYELEAVLLREELTALVQ